MPNDNPREQDRPLVDQEDNQIILRIQGDIREFQKLVQKYQTKVIWTAYQMLGNYEEARDVSQEVFLRIYRSLSQFRPENNFYTWLYRITVNLCIDFWRKNRHEPEVSADGEMGDIDAEEIPMQKRMELKEDAQKVQKILQQVPERYRVMLVMRDIEDLSCREIEEILHCNHNTIRWRLFRARQIFKEIWEKTYPNEIPK